jgi:hypothetical protein
MFCPFILLPPEERQSRRERKKREGKKEGEEGGREGKRERERERQKCYVFIPLSFESSLDTSLLLHM